MAKIIIWREKYPFGSEEYLNADEHWHQVCSAEFVRLELPQYNGAFFAIPNGGSRGKDKRTAQIEGSNLRMEGVKTGVPDTMLAAPSCVIYCGAQYNYHGLYIELKRPHKSYGVSDKQTEFMADARARGYATAVAVGWHEFVGYVLYYTGMISAVQARDEYNCNVNPIDFGSGYYQGR